MKIKKVDDKPMVIHTKKKAKLHTHEPKKASIKVAGAAGAQTALSQMEGGEKVRDAANIASNRCYRKAHNFDYCYEEIEKNLGKMYDPIVGIDVLDNWDEITSVVNR